MNSAVLKVAVMLASLGCTAWLSRPPKDEFRGDYLAPLLPRLELLKILGAGQQPMVTDYYWLQAIQAAGRAGQARTIERHRWLDLYYYADLVTNLDPKFYKVYAFAGNAVPTNLGRETWVNTAEGIALLEKGLKHFPNDWRLNLYIASHLSYFNKDHARAAEHLERASRDPAAPSSLPFLAGMMHAYSGDFETALTMADAALASTRDPELIEYFEARKLDLLQERVLTEVDAAVKRFREREGRLPGDIGELVARGDLPGYPVDPLQGVISLDESGRALSSVKSARLEPETAEKRKRKYED